MCYTIGIETLLCDKKKTDMFLLTIEDNGFIYSSYEGKNGIFIKVFMDSDDTKNKMSEILSEYVYINYVKSEFSKVLDECYYYFEQNDKNEMFAMLCKDKEKNILKNEILKYFEKNHTLYLSGFVNFRLASYFEKLYDKAQFIADDYLEKKEYMDFIKLLKYFVSVQSASCERVDVIKKQDGRYVIFDQDKNQIDMCDCEVSVEIVDDTLGVCDVVLSELISLAPKRIVFHKNACDNEFEEDELLKMLECVFENSVEYCTGCGVCEKYKQEDFSIKCDDKIK